MLEFNFFPSLKLITLNKISILLAVKNNVIALVPNDTDHLVNFNDDLYIFENRYIPKNLVRDIENLPLPHSLKYELFATYKKITWNIHRWKRENKDFHLFYEFLCNHFYLVKWSSYGDIDEEETAKTVINLHDLDIKKRLYLACYYSLENYILELRPRVKFENLELLPETFMVRSSITLYWLLRQDLTLPLRDILRLERGRFYLSALEIKNLGAMKYFYSKLNEEGKQSVREHNICALNFLMKDEQKSSHATGLFLFLFHQCKQIAPMGFLMRFTPEFLNYFLRWPMQKHFFDAFDQLFPYLDPKSFNKLLVNIAHKAQDGWMLYPYHRAFRTVWLKGTREMKKYVMLKIARQSNPHITHYLSLDRVSRRLFFHNSTDYVF